MAGEWLVRLANFENLNIVLLLNFIFVSENHITVVAVHGYTGYPWKEHQKISSGMLNVEEVIALLWFWLFFGCFNIVKCHLLKRQNMLHPKIKHNSGLKNRNSLEMGDF